MRIHLTELRRGGGHMLELRDLATDIQLWWREGVVPQGPHATRGAVPKWPDATRGDPSSCLTLEVSGHRYVFHRWSSPLVYGYCAVVEQAVIVLSQDWFSNWLAVTCEEMALEVIVPPHAAERFVRWAETDGPGSVPAPGSVVLEVNGEPVCCQIQRLSGVVSLSPALSVVEGNRVSKGEEGSTGSACTEGRRSGAASALREKAVYRFEPNIDLYKAQSRRGLTPQGASGILLDDQTATAMRVIQLLVFGCLYQPTMVTR